MQTKSGEIQARKTSNKDTFHAMIIRKCYSCKLILLNLKFLFGCTEDNYVLTYEVGFQKVVYSQ